MAAIVAAGLSTAKAETTVERLALDRAIGSAKILTKTAHETLVLAAAGA
jgi:hypothetical protein